MPPDATDTKVLPVPGQEQTTYSLNLDRCAIEMSLRPLGLPIARARLRARAGELAVTGRPPVASIRLEVRAAPDRVSMPLGVALFRSRSDRRRLVFTATDVEMIVTRQPIAMKGELDDADEPSPLPLTVRFVHVDEHAVVLAARGPLRPMPGRWLWVEAAMEFTR
ncbi:MAG TPA: hypothetical protein VF892_18570 [Pseudonocardiaceae bacterium]